MSNKKIRILAINPGSTSTKIGIFDDGECLVEKVVRHTREELDACGGDGVYGQKELRRELVLSTLKENNIALDTLDVISPCQGRQAKQIKEMHGTAVPWYPQILYRC